MLIHHAPSVPPDDPPGGMLLTKIRVVEGSGTPRRSGAVGWPWVENHGNMLKPL